MREISELTPEYDGHQVRNGVYSARRENQLNTLKTIVGSSADPAIVKRAEEELLTRESIYSRESTLNEERAEKDANEQVVELLINNML